MNLIKIDIMVYSTEPDEKGETIYTGEPATATITETAIEFHVDRNAKGSLSYRETFAVHAEELRKLLRLHDALLTETGLRG